MKKTLLLFAMLLGVVGAWAQEDNFVTPEAGKFYIIKGDHATHHWLTGVVEGEGIDVSDNKENAGVYYYDGTSLKLYNSQTYIGKNNDHISLVGTKTNVTLTSHGSAGKYIINVGGHNLYNNQSDYTREAGGTISDPGNNRFTWGFILVDNIKMLKLTSEELKSGVSIYTYHNNSKSGSWYGKLQTKTTPKVVIEAENKQFNGVGWSDSKPYLKQGAAYNISVPAGYKITEYSMTTSAGENFAGTYTYTTSGDPAESQAAGTVNVTGLSTNQICLELTSGSGGIIISNLNITYEIEQINYSLTDDAGNVYNGVGLKRYDRDELAIGGVDEYILSNGILENGVYTANISFPVPVSKTDGFADKEVIICAYKGTLNPGVAKYFVDGDTQIKANPSAAVADKKDRWVIYPTCTNGNFTFAIKNVGTGKYIKSNFDNAQKDEANAVVVAGSGYTNFTISEGNRFRVPVTKNGVETYLSVGSSGTKDKVVGLWSWYGTKNGTSVVHYGISNFVYEAQLPYVITDNFGNKYLGTIDASTGNPNTLTPTITGVPADWLSAFTFDGMKLNATVAFPFSVSSAEVANIVLMSIGGDQRKWSARKGLNDEYYIHILNDTPELGTWQWVIYPQFEGGVFKYKIMNVATGKYVYAKPENTGDQPQPQGWVDDDHNSYPVILNDEGTAFEIEMSNNKPRFTYQSNSKKLYLTVNGSGSNDCPLGVWSDTHSYEDVTFPELQDFNVTIGSAGYATLYSPITVVQEYEQMLNPETLVEIYQIKDEPQNGSLTLSQENYVLKNEGVILKGNPGTYRFGNAGEDWEYIRPDDWTNNKLSGSETNTYVKGDAYVLSAPDGVESVGLYKALLNKDANGEDGTTHFKNNAGKAYLPASALSAEAAESRFFLFGFGDGEETGITETENGKVKTENTVVYDLAGRRVQSAQKGIFIVNGKKVVR